MKRSIDWYQTFSISCVVARYSAVFLRSHEPETVFMGSHEAIPPFTLTWFRMGGTGALLADMLY